MPSPNPRIQVCTAPPLYAQLKTIAKGRNCTLSNVVQDLCRLALQTEEMRDEYTNTSNLYGSVPELPDNRERIARPHFKASDEQIDRSSVLRTVKVLAMRGETDLAEQLWDTVINQHEED